MNKDAYVKLERRRLLEVAREYEARGYRVEVEPSRFLPLPQDIRPDLVAVSEKETVVIEVVSKNSIRDRERLETLAKSVENLKGWRFELVVTNPREPSVHSISLKEIRVRVQQAQLFGQQAMVVPALLTAWSATEALLRRVAAAKDIGLAQGTPVRLVKTLYSLGLLAGSDYELLEGAARARNATIHGFRYAEPVPIQVVLEGLLGVASRLLDRLEPSSRLPSREYTVDELVGWFFDNYEDPANGVPYEGGYIYVSGGPYDAWDELSLHFPDASEALIRNAVEEIEAKGNEWVRRGQY